MVPGRWDDGHGGDPWMERFGGGFTAGDRAPQDGQPDGRCSVAGLFWQLRQQFRRTAGSGH
jgi:hypothetical protein